MDLLSLSLSLTHTLCLSLFAFTPLFSLSLSFCGITYSLPSLSLSLTLSHQVYQLRRHHHPKGLQGMEDEEMDCPMGSRCASAAESLPGPSRPNGKVRVPRSARKEKREVHISHFLFFVGYRRQQAISSDESGNGDSEDDQGHHQAIALRTIAVRCATAPALVSRVCPRPRLCR